MKYCVYITIYKGNKLPPFYIGSSTTDKVLDKKYHGTVASLEYSRIWKSELKLNKILFVSHIIKKFEFRNEALEYEEYLHRKLDVVNNILYINKCYARKGFVQRPYHTQQEKDNISNTLKNRKNTWGDKISGAMKNKPKSESHKQNLRKPKSVVKYWHTNGTDNKKFIKGQCPSDYTLGFTVIEPKKWYNNGVTNKLFVVDAQLPGYVIGKIPLLKKCEYCNKSINLSNYIRWHGNNCKNYTILQPFL